MENSTDSANRNAVAPYGRAYPPGLRPSAPSPTAPACAFGGAPLRGSPGFAGSPSGYRAGLRPGGLPRRGTPRRWQLHRLHPHPAPCPLKGRKKRFSREKRLAEAVPHIERQRGRKGRRLNAKRRASSQAAELASIVIPDEAGPEPRPSRAGAPRRPGTGQG